MQSTHEERLKRARESLEGLSVGDAFGVYAARGRIQKRLLMSPPWHFTDDTNMALSIFSILRQYKSIDQDVLALDFAIHFDNSRGYGPGMRRLLPSITRGTPWHEAAKKLFGGEGSFGNGGAMRIAPLGTYFADDLETVVEQARLASEITHAHPEGIAGGMAVAIAAAVAEQQKASNETVSRAQFLDKVLAVLPDSFVKEQTRLARDLEPTASTAYAVQKLGNGSAISAQDTVPFCLWCAGEQLSNYEEALWLTASAGGDVDTNCAIVGGIVASYTGVEGIPTTWLSSREPLPEWAFTEGTQP